MVNKLPDDMAFSMVNIRRKIMSQKEKENVQKFLDDALAVLRLVLNSREKSLVVTKIQEAGFWLNEVK